MDINTLHPHNREAYQKIMQHFDEGHQRVCVVHATGTGKSYIINAVCNHFERVLIMTTNMFTIDQVRDTIKTESPERTTEPVYKIYPALLQDMDNHVDCLHKYDLIVLDEFHHGGAVRWGQAVTWLLEQNPDAKVLGTSATSIRHSDNMRDMGEELFDGHVLSRLPLGEAWARKILMAPYYIMAVEDSEEFYNEFIKKIEESKLLEEKKHFYREMASYLKDNYEMEKNAADIIRKWLPSDSRRVIVFSRNIEEAESNVSKVEGWMKKAGFNVDNIYMVHSQRPFEEKKAQMTAFLKDNFNGIKIMVAVDMLNEGVHIPRVDAVFFLRKTESPTIFLQQMGRCMGLYKEGGRRPVVFDFRNNVENTNRSTSTHSFFGEAAKDYDNWKDLEEKSLDSQTIRNTEKEEKLRENFPDGINYTMDYGIMIDRFGEDVKYQDEWGLLEYYVGIVEEYYKNYGKKIPKRGEYSKIYATLMNFWRNEKRRAERPEVVEILRRSGFEDKIYEDKLMVYTSIAEKYYIKHGRKISSVGVYKRAYSNLMDFWYDNIRREKRPDVVKILLRSGFDNEKEDLLMKYALIAEEYFIQHGKKIPEGGKWRTIYGTLMRFWNDKTKRDLRPDVVQILQRSGFVNKEDLLMKYALEAEVYFIKNGVKISAKAGGINLYNCLNSFWRNEKRQAERPDVVEILEKSGFDNEKEDLLMKYALEAEVYFIKNGVKISAKAGGVNLYNCLNSFWRNEKRRAERPEIVEILRRSGFEDKIHEDRLMFHARQAEKYFNKTNKKYTHSSLNEFWRNEKRRAERPDVVKILLRSGFDNEKEDLLMKYALFAENYYKLNKRRITTKDKGCIKYCSKLKRFWNDKTKRDLRPEVVEILLRSGFKEK